MPIQLKAKQKNDCMIIVKTQKPLNLSFLHEGISFNIYKIYIEFKNVQKYQKSMLIIIITVFLCVFSSVEKLATRPSIPKPIG